MIWRNSVNREVLDVCDMRDREPARQSLQDPQPPVARRAARREAGGEFDGARGCFVAAGLLRGLGHAGFWVQKSDEENVT